MSHTGVFARDAVAVLHQDGAGPRELEKRGRRECQLKLVTVDLDRHRGGPTC